ncbi:valine--tRNA ligase [candidate division WWE3 bacterium]|nr:valine--tRNA ligase [candidate division WWE3 bacterium]
MSPQLPKQFNHKEIEPKIYKMWEEKGLFMATRDPKKIPYTIVLPPPNASGRMHTGNVLMVAIEDLLIRWKRMKGYSALWLPGTDHAGFETQVTYERELKKQGKSRFDFDRETLYNNIWEFVQQNKGIIEDQLKKMGASVDWSRYTFTLDPHVIKTVHATFKKMHDDGLIYRDNYIVNFSPKDGTTFADLEVKTEERNDPFYYVRYPLLDRKDGEVEFVVCATVRPEPIFIDTHLAVNPSDESKKWLIGRQVSNPLTGATMNIIADSFVDPAFGTGVVKLTPAHDKNDFDVARRHNLPILTAIDMRGKVLNIPEAGELAGLYVTKARKKAVEILQAKGFIEKIDEKYVHGVSVSYKGGDIEPMVLPNWFVKVETLKKPALDAVLNGDITIYPKWREVTYTQWMEEMRDWPISRQVVWGIRIPVWYSAKENPELVVSFLSADGKVLNGTLGDLLKDHNFAEIKNGLQTLIAPKNAKYVISSEDPKLSDSTAEDFLPETDTFDTWFSSGQWPLVTLHYPDSEDFNYFYPTSVLETGWEIIRFWVSRMIMFGIYLTGKSPFKDVYLHGIVKALDGKKMSKSLGNVINPEEYQEQYGTDALRMGLISGTANGKDFAFPKDKVIAFRNFANKLWNMTRFMFMLEESSGVVVPEYSDVVLARGNDADRKIVGELHKLVGEIDTELEKYRFGEAGDKIYHFMWDSLAASYIEHIKDRQDKDVALSIFRYVFKNCLKLLHPFMPFVTEELWGYMKSDDEAELVVNEWPQV